MLLLAEQVYYQPLMVLIKMQEQPLKPLGLLVRRASCTVNVRETMVVEVGHG